MNCLLIQWSGECFNHTSLDSRSTTDSTLEATGTSTTDTIPETSNQEDAKKQDDEFGDPLSVKRPSLCVAFQETKTTMSEETMATDTQNSQQVLRTMKGELGKIHRVGKKRMKVQAEEAAKQQQEQRQHKLQHFSMLADAFNN